MFASVSIVFPIFGGWADTQTCLASIDKLDYPKNKLEVVIVDNHSPGDSGRQLSKITKRFPRLKLNFIINSRNVGFGRATNQGVNHAKGQLILITNNDVTFEKNCLNELITVFLRNKQAGMVCGGVYSNKAKLCIDGFRLNPYLAFHQYDLQNQDKVREIDWSIGPCFLLRRRLFRHIGGFDEKFFHYFEDVDFSLRVRKQGLKIYYAPKAVVHHGYGRSMYRNKRSFIYYHAYYSRWRCILKNATKLQIATSLLFVFLFTVPVQIYLSRFNMYRPAIRSLWDNLRNKDANTEPI